jgi:hypothetical protein
LQLDKRLIESRRKMKLAEDILKPVPKDWDSDWDWDL